MIDNNNEAMEIPEIILPDHQQPQQQQDQCSMKSFFRKSSPAPATFDHSRASGHRGQVVRSS